MIFVSNKKNMPIIKENSVFINIMRPSVLSNKWSHNPNTAAIFIVNSRKEAVEEYRKYFLEQVNRKGAFRDEVIRIFQLAKHKNVYLMCCCAPLYCHGNVIYDFLIEHLGNTIFEN